MEQPNRLKIVEAIRDLATDSKQNDWLMSETDGTPGKSKLAQMLSWASAWRLRGRTRHGETID